MIFDSKMTVFSPVFSHFFHCFFGFKIKSSDNGGKNKGKKNNGEKRKSLEKRTNYA